MDPVREVQRRRSGRHFLDFAAGREDEHLVLEDVLLDRLDPLLGLRDLPLPVHQLADPGQSLLVAVVTLRAFLVAPVGRDAVLGRVVHFARPDLHLKRLSLKRHHRRVQRLVHALLRHRDVVVERPWKRVPDTVHDAESLVTVGLRCHLHADGEQVVDLVDAAAF